MLALGWSALGAAACTLLAGIGDEVQPEGGRRRAHLAHLRYGRHQDGLGRDGCLPGRVQRDAGGQGFGTSGTSGTAVLFPSLTASVPNDLLVLLGAYDAIGSGTAWTPPTGTVMRASTDVVAVFDETLRVAGATSGRSASVLPAPSGARGYQNGAVLLVAGP